MNGKELINKHLGEKWLYGNLTWTFELENPGSDSFYIAHQFSNFGEFVQNKNLDIYR